MNLDRILPGVALVLSVAALAWSLDTVLSASRRRELLDRKAEAIQSLQRLANRHAAERAWLDSLTDATPEPLVILATRCFPEASPSTTPRAPASTASGWQCRETLLTLAGVSFGEIPAFCAEVAKQRPPWRLGEVELRPSEKVGRGDAVLLFGTLEKGTGGE